MTTQHFTTTLAVLLTSLGIAASPVNAGEIEEYSTPMFVKGASICRDVDNRTPIDPGTVFTTDDDKLCAFTPVYMAGEPTTVTHVWKLNGRELQRITLDVEGYRFRTWSRVTMHDHLLGNYEVDVIDEEGRVLVSLPFEFIEPTRDQAELPSQEQESSSEDTSAVEETEQDLDTDQAKRKPNGRDLPQVASTRTVTRKRDHCSVRRALLREQMRNEAEILDAMLLQY